MAFDAYHKWLGVPPAEQPPHHYRLLGIALFESDCDVIEGAADRQMAHVRTFQAGQHSAVSQQILNELAAAKLCLLNPQKKDAYDAELRRRLDASQAGQPHGAAPRPRAVGAGLQSAAPAPASVADADCPDAASLSDFALGKLDAPATERIIHHLATCDGCRQKVADVSSDGFVDLLRAAVQAPEHAANPGRTLVDREAAEGLETTIDYAKSPPSAVGRKARSAARSQPELANHPDYEIIKELGHGGMGVVYLARNRLMDRLEVLKVLNQSLLERPGALERFQQEIRSAAKLSHINIVAAYAVLRMGDSLVFAMEYVPGQDLAHVVARRGPLRVPNAAYYAHQAALGLQHAHEKGMVHRDIKPNNLMLAVDGKKHIVKILDFGLAKATSEKDGETGLTKSGQILGTPDYLAPEQSRDAQHADIRADIYSLGCTLYFLLSGKRPFPEASLYDVLDAHQRREATPLDQLRPEVPAELAAMVAKMMAKSPADRYQTPVEVARALIPFFKPGQSAAPAKPRDDDDHPQFTMETAAASEKAAVEPLAAPATWPSPQPAFPLSPLRAVPIAVLLPTTAFDTSIDFDTPLIDTDHELRPPSRNWRLYLATCLVPVLLMLGIALVVRTSHGTIEIELSDPDAKVTLAVDGNRVDIAGLDEPLSLEMGEHDLTIKGAGYETISRHFKVTRGKNAPLKLTLVGDRKENEGRSDAARAPEAAGPSGSQIGFGPPSGRALAFDGKSSFVQVPSSPSLDSEALTKAATFEAWLYLNEQPSAVRRDVFIMGISKYGYGNDMDLQVDKDDKVHFYVGVGYPDGQIASNTVLQAGRWYHVAATFQAGEPGLLQLFINGALDASRTRKFARVRNAEPLTIGWSRVFGRYFHGQIADTSVWSTVRSQSEIQADMRAIATGTRGLVAYWPLNLPGDGSGTRLHDATANHNDGSLGNGAAAHAPAWVSAARQIEKDASAGAGPRGAATNRGPTVANEQGFVSLFNGKDLTGWKTHPKQPGNWRVKNAVLIGSGPDVSHLYSERGDFTNFDLRVEARINDGGDSGVTGRASFGPVWPTADPEWPTGYEAQISSTASGPKTGSVWKQQYAVCAVTRSPVPPNEWFVLELLAVDNQVIVKINGERMASYADTNRSFPMGHLVLQQGNPQTTIEFRKIELKEHDVPNAMRATAPSDTDAAAKPGVVPPELVGTAARGTPSDWSRLISASSIEDEIKLQAGPPAELTKTPSVFKGGGNQPARVHFTELAMLFGIIAQYDGDVRWKKNALGLRDIYKRAGVNCKVGTDNSYKEARQRSDDLAQLITGGKLELPKPDPSAKWADIANRPPLMQRMGMEGYDPKIKAWTSDNGEFSKNRNALLVDAQIVAVIARLIQDPSYEYADDETYIGIAKALEKAALEIVEAVKVDSLERAQAAAGQLNKACLTCHEGYRATARAERAARSPAAVGAPAFQQWVDDVRALPAEKQYEAVMKKLRELNTGSIGKVTHHVETGAVVELGLHSTGLTNLSPVRALSGLKRFTYRGDWKASKRFNDLSPLSGLPLSRLDCQFSGISDLSPLKGIPLTYFDCSNSTVSDLSPLIGMKLSSLRCAGTKVVDLSPLAGMPLTSLDISQTLLEDLGPLKGGSLTSLVCGHSNVRDLSPLAGMPLTLLDISGNPQADLTAIKSLPLRTIRCDVSNQERIDVLRSIKSLATINYKPAQTALSEAEQAIKARK